MSPKNQTDLKNAHHTVADIIRAIEEKSADGAYIFRGESQYHEKVSSSLYRKLEEVGLLDLGVETLQKEELKYVKGYGYTQETEKI